MSHPPRDPHLARKTFGDVAPKFSELSDDVLFGDVWERPQLSKRDRSLITCAALVTTGGFDQMAAHFPLAIANGVTREELIEMITHLAFYSGWPKSVTSVMRVRELLPENGSVEKKA